MIQIFFSLGEIAKQQRSKIDRIQLVAVFKEKLIKKVGFKKIYEQLVKDLKLLELGVTVHYPVQQIVKCGVLMHPADNLEAHGVGGFSSKDICRWCHCQHSDLLENIHDYGLTPHARWTVEEYDKAAVAAKKKKKDQESKELDHSSTSSEEQPSEESEDEDETELFGVTHTCPLNSLQSFHATTGFPPDILHDHFEGVLSQDLLGIIRILILKKWFSLEDYNKKLMSLKLKSYEANNKPQCLPTNKKTKKLIGKACSIWVHIRNFPFVIRDFVRDLDDSVLMLGLRLHSITERLTASEFRSYEVAILEDQIVEYLDERMKIYEDYPDMIGTPKPKTHFLYHYPAAIRQYGPPMSYWTARYESRHRIAKNTAESAKNFKNISFTVSNRQQMRLSSVYYHGMFSTSDLVISDRISFKNSLKGDSDFDKAILPFMSAKDFLCSEVEHRNQLYKSGQLVVLEMFSPDEVKVGLIMSILVRKQVAYFVTRQFVAKRQPLQYFQAHSDDPTVALTEATKIVDFKPLENQLSLILLSSPLHKLQLSIGSQERS